MRGLRPALVVLAVIALCVAAAGGGYSVTRPTGSHPAAGPSATPGPTSSALASSTASPAAIAGSPAAEPLPASISAALTPALADPALGRHVLAEVTDAISGDVLYDRGATTPAAPASTAKLATAVAVLTVHKPTDRITTTVVDGSLPGQLVLVGAGDPTLSAAPAATPTLYADAARVSDLAGQIKASGVAFTRLLVDDHLFTGPAVSPAWGTGDAPSDYAAPITAAMVDGGRDTPAATVRSATPDLAAGRALAAALGLDPSSVVLGSAPATPIVVATVESAPYGELLRQMLLDSDNVLAEVLARQVALARGAPASFAGAAAAVRAVSVGLGLDIGPGLVDGSGLAASDRLAPSALVGVLRLISTDPDLHPIVDDLPVAGWDGTLAGRYLTPPAKAVAGLVRAKTGTLTGVSTLAGFVTMSSGRVLLFSLVADRVGPTVSATGDAESALDAAIAGL